MGLAQAVGLAMPTLSTTHPPRGAKTDRRVRACSCVVAQPGIANNCVTSLVEAPLDQCDEVGELGWERRTAGPLLDRSTWLPATQATKEVDASHAPRDTSSRRAADNEQTFATMKASTTSQLGERRHVASTYRARADPKPNRLGGHKSNTNGLQQRSRNSPRVAPHAGNMRQVKCMTKRDTAVISH